MRVRVVLGASLALILIVSGCSSPSGDDSAATSIAASATTKTTVATTTTTRPAATTTTTAPQAPVGSYTLTSNLVYMALDGVDMKMDVYVPTSDGPSPVVVTFHGLEVSGKNAPDTVAVAREAATEGMVVFVPTWLPPNATEFTAEGYQANIEISNCALAFAQQNAAEFGGDAAATVVDGFSAGTFSAMITAFEPALDSVPGCATDAVPGPVAGVVLGDGEYFLYSTAHDASFEADPVGMQDVLSRLLVAENWPPDVDTEFFLWVAEEDSYPRAIEGLDDESGWFALRDPDRSIRADLDLLGQLEDGFLTTTDAGQLLSFRLSQGGVTVTLDAYPGDHNTIDKASEIVGYFKAAAAP